MYFRQTYCKCISFVILRWEILGETLDRLKRSVIVQIPEVTIYHENVEHIRLTSFHWRCETVEMRGTCFEVQKSMQ